MSDVKRVKEWGEQKMRRTADEDKVVDDDDQAWEKTPPLYLQIRQLQ